MQQKGGISFNGISIQQDETIRDNSSSNTVREEGLTSTSLVNVMDREITPEPEPVPEVMIYGDDVTMNSEETIPDDADDVSSDHEQESLREPEHETAGGQ